MTSENLSSPNQQNFSDQTTQSWVDRNGFAHWAVAVFWFIAAFFLFQIIGGVVGAILLIPEIMEVMQAGGDVQTEIEAIFSENLGKVFIGNTTGQFLIIGLASYLMAKLHAVKGQHKKFLRLQTSPNVWKVTLITAVLVFVFMPLNGFLGWLNYLAFEGLQNSFPSLEFFSEMQDSMSEMIRGFIGTENAVILAFIHIGIVPSLFEEVMFRGYIMRALEKSGGIIAAILISGFLFGAYHVQPANLIPLSMLGILFAYVTYVSNSLIPAMVAHLLNNGSQVIYGASNPEFLEATMSSELEISPLLIVSSTIFSALLIYLLYKTHKSGQTENQHV